MADEIYFIDPAVMQGWGDLVREKTNTEDKLLPNELLEKTRENWENGGEDVFVVEDTGVLYKTHMKHITNGTSANHSACPSYQGASELISYETDLVGNGYCFANNIFKNCTKLERVVFSRLSQIITPIDTYYGCTALKTIQYGSVGYPMTQLSDGRMLRGTSHALELTIYVEASTLAEIPTTISGSSPWGNPNAVIIYRNSTTGEVIEA